MLSSLSNHNVGAQLALVVLLVAGIHFIEAYGLNPAIYSAHLKLHPLLVLSVLVVAEHSLGVWGLLLAGALAINCCAWHPPRLPFAMLMPFTTLSLEMPAPLAPLNVRSLDLY